MPTTGQPSLPFSGPTATTGNKIDQPVRQIALRMASPSHNIVTIPTSAQARPSATASVVTGPSVTTSSTVPITSAARIPGLTQLGLMVTRYNPGDRPTVLLQPRTPSAGRAVVVSSPNPALGQRIVRIPTIIHARPTHARPTIIPVNQTVLTTFSGPGPVSRHTIISAGPSTVPPQRIITTQPSVQSQPIVTLAASAPINSAITTSPVKQSIPTATPPSPRPSILIRKRNFTDSLSSQVSSNSSQPTIQCTTAAGTIVKAPTAASATVKVPTAPSTIVKLPTPLGTPVKIPTKQPEGESDASQTCNYVTDGLVEASPLNVSSSQSTTTSDAVTTPKKRTRKQLLEPFNPTKSSANIRLFPSTGEEKKTPSSRTASHPTNNESSMQVLEESDEEEQMESDEASQEDAADSPIILPSSTNRPRLSMLNSYTLPSKSLQYHFLRYTDVKPKPEKKLTLSELSNQVLHKKNGWKIHHLSAQLEDTSNNEAGILDRLQKILDTFERELSKVPLDDDELPLGSNTLPVKVSLRDRLSDLIRGNIQRSVIYQDQSTESRQLLIKLTNDHREKVAKLTKKNLNKRTCISK